MRIHDTALPEVKILALDIFHDARGFFCERFHAEKFAALGMKEAFVQTNHSRSLPSVVRGLHFQYAPMQGKLIGVTGGAVLDVAVDIRPSSPNFGKHVAVELNATNGELLWIPAGFAHGFAVLGDVPADMVYQMNAPYNAMGEGGIAFNDADIGIAWPIANPILSERDRHLPRLHELKPHLQQWFPA
jgi:dTDP-4-dehydrorhamnose 3,5-epimerase